MDRQTQMGPAEHGPSHPDVIIRDEGTIVVFHALSETAQHWVDEYVELVPHLTLGDHSFAAEHRPAKEIIDGLYGAGFDIKLVR